MAYANREHVCPDCGTKHRRRAPAKPPARCRPCNVAFAADVALQMHNKSGPMYTKWSWQMLVWARKNWAEADKEQARRVA